MTNWLSTPLKTENLSMRSWHVVGEPSMTFKLAGGRWCNSLGSATSTTSTTALICSLKWVVCCERATQRTALFSFTLQLCLCSLWFLDISRVCFVGLLQLYVEDYSQYSTLLSIGAIMSRGCLHPAGPSWEWFNAQ